MLAAMQLYRTSDFYFTQALSGLPDEVITRRIGIANSIVWTAGHVTVGRLRILREVGEEVEIPWTDLFGKGADETPSTAFPPLDSVVACWTEATPRLHDRLEALSELDLSRRIPLALPNADRTLGDMITFFAFHEAYHIGQIAVLRKAMDIAPRRRTADRVLAEGSLC